MNENKVRIQVSECLKLDRYIDSVEGLGSASVNVNFGFLKPVDIVLN